MAGCKIQTVRVTSSETNELVIVASTGLFLAGVKGTIDGTFINQCFSFDEFASLFGTFALEIDVETHFARAAIVMCFITLTVAGILLNVTLFFVGESPRKMWLATQILYTLAMVFAFLVFLGYINYDACSQSAAELSISDGVTVKCVMGATSYIL